MRIAQLTDLHLLEERHTSRSGMPFRRLAYLSFGRPLDAPSRRQRAQRALAAAAAAQPDHLVLTGDLTEDGTPAQFEVLAELLSEGGLSADRVTLLPGNHDVYDTRSGFTDALAGPLRPYAAQSAAGAVLDLADLSLVTVDTAVPQHYFWSGGGVGQEHWQRVLGAVDERRRRNRVVVLAQHHPAARHRLPLMQWIDGNHDFALARALLAASDGVYVMHGHVHEERTERIAGEARVFSAPAVVDHDLPLRLYALGEGGRLLRA